MEILDFQSSDFECERPTFWPFLLLAYSVDAEGWSGAYVLPPFPKAVVLNGYSLPKSVFYTLHRDRFYPSQSIQQWEGSPCYRRGSEAIRVANLLAADPLAGGRAIAGNLLTLRVTDLIRNAGLR